MDPTSWPTLKTRLAALFATRSRAEWCAVLEHSDACFAPVLAMAEAPLHPHNVARHTFVEVEGVVQPAPAPRFNGTPSAAPTAPPTPDSAGVLSALGFAPEEISRLSSLGAIA